MVQASLLLLLLLNVVGKVFRHIPIPPSGSGSSLRQLSERECVIGRSGALRECRWQSLVQYGSGLDVSGRQEWELD